MLNRQLILLISTLSLVACKAGQKQTLQQSATHATLPSGAPKYSDVCFSSRWERPRDANDTLETFDAARSFHATYLNWVYTTNPTFIQKAAAQGYRLQVALTPTLPDLPLGSITREKGRILNKAGQKVTAPWMKGLNNWWGCVNHPEFQATYFAHLEVALRAGAYGFQVDDPAMGYLLLRNQWEDVCHCEFCKAKAKKLNIGTNEIQKASVKDFHQEMKRKAEVLAGRPVPFSCNNFEGDWELFPFSEFDFGLAEIPERRANPEYIYASVREAKRRGKAQVFTFSNDREWLVQKMIAVTYACGANMLVPWDVWQGGGKERYFGKPTQFAALFGFVRAVANWLDGYEDAFYANSQDENRFVDVKELPVGFDTYSRQLHAFVRAKPFDESAPVVVHLIDWHVLMEPFSMHLNRSFFSRKGISSIELLTPVVFEEKLHKEAAASGNFSKLVASQRLDFKSDGDLIRLEIPKLEQHWGILLVRTK